MIAYKHLLSAKQKQDILNALQAGSGVRIKPTKTQLGNGLGAILQSWPKVLGTVLQYPYFSVIFRFPLKTVHLFGNPGAQFTLQKYTSLRNHSVKPKFHKNIAMSNHDLLEWCRYLNIPMKDVLPRDQTLKNHPYNHKKALLIYKLGHLI